MKQLKKPLYQKTERLGIAISILIYGAKPHEQPTDDR